MQKIENIKNIRKNVAIPINIVVIIDVISNTIVESIITDKILPNEPIVKYFTFLHKYLNKFKLNIDSNKIYINTIPANPNNIQIELAINGKNPK